MLFSLLLVLFLSVRKNEEIESQRTDIGGGKCRGSSGDSADQEE